MEKGEGEDICMEEKAGMIEAESWFYSRKQWKWRGNLGVQEASCDNSLMLYLLRHSIIRVTASTEGRGESLQVDELVHQQQGARQAGQAGFRATTVTTRVASWNWPGETRGGEEANRRGEGKQRSRGSQQAKGGWGREKREEQGEEFTHLIVWTQLWRNGAQKQSIQLLKSPFQANEGMGEIFSPPEIC